MPKKSDFIHIQGIKENNLKNIDVLIPKNQVSAIIGPSGSGKSTLAFNVLYNEANRVFFNALSLKNKSLGIKLSTANIDSISGISPAIAIKSRKQVSNVRSTIATATDIYNDLRLLFTYFSTPHCPKCNTVLSSIPTDKIISQVLNFPEETKISILSPIINSKKGNFKGLLQKLQADGYIRFEVDGDTYLYEDIPLLSENKKHSISVIIDRVKIKASDSARLSDSIHKALALSGGKVIIKTVNQEYFYSTILACGHCDIYYEEIDLKLFSYNHPSGACPKCHGLGTSMTFDPNKFFDPDKTIEQNGITFFRSIKGTAIRAWIAAIADYAKFDFHTPLKNFSKEQLDILLYGKDVEIDLNYKSDKISGTFKRKLEGLIQNAERRLKETKSIEMKNHFEKNFMKKQTCPTCKGQKLNDFALNCKINDHSISYYCSLTLSQINKYLLEDEIVNGNSNLSNPIYKKLKGELLNKLEPLINIGLGYLNLDRTLPSLSGGEESRIHLSSQISSGLEGVIYLLDEPGTALHPSDMNKLSLLFSKIVENNNTVILVDHDEFLIKNSNHIIELGPLAGEKGGELIFQGPITQFIKSNTLTAKLIYQKQPKHTSTSSVPSTGLEIVQASHYNLKNINLLIPEKSITVICGVSGSGKSTLVDKIIYPYLANTLMHSKRTIGKCKSITGAKYFDSIYYVDQTSIGKNARSNPATYLGIFDEIRKVFASTSEAKYQGFGVNKFSFNSKEGRCDRCKGLGTVKINMHYLPDMYLNCTVCNGMRYKNDVLQIKYKDLSIYDILTLSFDDALSIFKNFPLIYEKIKIVVETGLGYLKLGQSSTTLSGGESQRIKIASELGKTKHGRTFYILDEPTNGLHLSDIENIISVLQKLKNQGHTVLIIEHNLSIISSADSIVELGPEGGENGGHLLYSGPFANFTKASTLTSNCFK